MPDQNSKPELRRKIHAQRKSLSFAEQVRAANNLANQAKRYPPLLSASRIASYREFSGEIGTSPLEAQFIAKIYLPKVINFRLSQMQFYQHHKRPYAFKLNDLGIREPAGAGPPIPPQHLDAVLVPLVAFQRDGARLGMGAGFYDRAFSFRKTRDSLKRPLLIGLAHSFQETTQLEADPWDVPLDAIITDLELIVV